jgi:hypothetical protein
LLWFARNRPKLGSFDCRDPSLSESVFLSWIRYGHFGSFRTWLQIGVPIAFVLTLVFVDEFLAVRALGMLALLAAEPVLSAAFLRPESARLLLVVLAYVWLTLGLFWVGMPYLLRDQIDWITRTGNRFRALTLAGLVYGLVVLVCAVAVF